MDLLSSSCVTYTAVVRYGLGDGNVWIQIVYSLDLHKFKVQDVPAEVCPEYGQGCTCSILLVRHVWEPDLERQGVSCQNDCHILL